MRSGSHYAHGRLSWLAVIEICVIVVALVLAYWLQLSTFQSQLPWFTGLAYVSIMMLSLTAFGLYDSEQASSLRAIGQKVFMAQFLALLLLTLLFFLFRPLAVGRGLVVIASLFSTIGVLGVRSWAFRRHLLSIPMRKVVVIGNDDDAQALSDIFQSSDAAATHSISEFISLAKIRDEKGLNEESGIDELVEALIEDERSTELVLAVRERRNSGVPMKFLLESRLRGLPVDDVVSFCEREIGLIKIDHLRVSWLVFGAGFDQSPGRAFWKRIVDLVASFLLLVFSAPILAIAALMIRIETGTPILFRQVRTGAFGKPVEILKLRSMRVDAEGDGVARWAQKDDDRITPVGRFLRKTRIDELPQLVNVLRGEMSFVGPRPERPVFVEELKEKIPFYEIRHYVKPGLTGWAQVRLPYGSSVEGAIKKLEYDLYYVKNNSVFFDLLILIETIRVVLRRKGQ